MPTEVTVSPKLTTKSLFGLFFLSSAVLVLEIALIRIFDVQLSPNLAYMVISAALFAFGLAGVFLSIFPGRSWSLGKALSLLSRGFAVSVLLVYVIVSSVPFDYTRVAREPLFQLLCFGVLYLGLLFPFFLAGLIISLLFFRRPEMSSRLYFFDLVGAGLGSLVVAPLILYYGGGGLLFFAAGMGLVAAWCFAGKPGQIKRALLAVGTLFVVLPLTWPGYVPIQVQSGKVGVWGQPGRSVGGDIELTVWDPVSRIDIVDKGNRKLILYDGGTQASTLFPFDGNYRRLRAEFGPDHYWGKMVIASHYLKADTGAEVLIIGSAGGQETKAALAFGASRVDGVELVESVVRLGQGRYSGYIGQIFNDPRVHLIVGEGRTYLRSTDKKYDIIQIFSNHTSSSIASGAFGMSTNYLQTVEAYQEYFEHLKPDGLLHINHPVYPRMIATTSAAWHRIGRKDFQRHVVVLDEVDGSTLPTFLVSMKPWTAERVEKIRNLFFALYEDSPRYAMVYDPLNPSRSEITLDFFNYPLPEKLIAQLDYQVRPPTDDWPFFNFIRRRLGDLDGHKSRFLPRGTEKVLKAFNRKNVPLDLAHIIVTGTVSLFYAAVFVFVPLYFSPAGQTRWSGKGAILLYFSCLGAGFIILELVWISILMKLIGSPVYTYATVIATLLVSAGIGSLVSGWYKVEKRGSGRRILALIICLGVMEVLIMSWSFDSLLRLPAWSRIGASALFIFPMGFFLGMPFPLGISLLRTRMPAAIPWAWAMNGLFTVVGSLLAVICSLLFGFHLTFFLGLCFYAVAFLCFQSKNLEVAS